MASNIQERLISQLSASHANTHGLVEGVDLETQVYSDGWRIRDILGHIAAWDRQVTIGLQAFMHGGEYVIPEYDEVLFNEADVKAQSYLRAEQIFQDWVSAREAFKDAVREMPADLLSVEFLYPWGDERGDVERLVEVMCEHEESHHAEIEEALRDPSAI